MSLTVSAKNAAASEKVQPSLRATTADTSLESATVPLSSHPARAEARRAIVKEIQATSGNHAGATLEAQPDIVRVTTYRVKKGDTASEIAESVASERHPREKQLAIMREINRCDLDKLAIGQKIYIPTKEQPAIVLHRITEGDTLTSISEKFNTTVAMLQILNKMGDSANIRAGEHLKVPWNPPRSPPEQDKSTRQPSTASIEKPVPSSSIESFVSGLKGDFGALCRSFESQGRTTAYANAKTDPGGASWGCYQIAKPTMPLFLNYLKEAGEMSDLTAEQKKVASKAYGALRGHQPESPEFKREWNYLAKTDPRDFRALQHNFILDTHLTPVLREARELGFDITPKTAEVFLSIGVQHARFDVILGDAARSITTSTATIEEQIGALYASRREYVKDIQQDKLKEVANSKKLSKDSKASVTEQVEKFWNSVLNRYDQEEKLALDLVQNDL